MNEIHCGISCNLNANVLKSAIPLFDDGIVDAIEWSFDTLFDHSKIPSWFIELLQAFSKEERLIGHGVHFSIFSGLFSKEQQNWLEKLRKTALQFPFAHVTEHFGFMTGKDFHKGAPLNIPYSETTLSIAKDRLLRMQASCNCPVGLENLAFSYDLESVKRHGEFLSEIVKDVNGFIILDLHNLYCQTKNFNLSFEDLLACYPLELVREIHISGGSWEASISEDGRMIRRDTHDESVPDEVFDYLRFVLPKVENLKFVVLEQLGNALHSHEQQNDFQNDFKKMKHIVSQSERAGGSLIYGFENSMINLDPIPFESNQLAKEQMILSSILESSNNYVEVKARLGSSELARTDWKIEEWEDVMLETAFEITQKWKG